MAAIPPKRNPAFPKIGKKGLSVSGPWKQLHCDADSLPRVGI
jgi:hypothetical protein